MPKSYSNLTFTESAHIGLNDDTPEVPLKIKRDVDIALDDNIRGVTIDYNVSGSTAQSGDHFYDALHIDVDSSATGGDTSQETRLVGIKCNVTDSGDSNDIYGGYFDARTSKTVANDIISQVNGVYSFVKTTHTAGEVKNLYGVNALVQTDNASSGTNLTSAAGIRGVVQQTNDSGKVVNNAYGVYGKIDLAASSNNGTFTNCDGVYGEIEIDDADSTIATARAVKAVIDSNAGTITSAYQFYGTTTSAGTITNNWGIYLQNSAKNYIEGTLQLPTYSSGTLVSDGSGNITVSSGGGEGGPYLPLAGGTLTGDLNGDIITLTQGAYTDGYRLIRSGHDTYRICLGNSEGLRIVNETDSSRVELSFDGAGGATFAGTVAASGDITATASNATISAAESGGATTKIMGASVGRVGTSSNHNLEILSNNTAAITIDTSQDATFAGTVTGTSATFNSGITVDNITIDGTEIDLSSGDLTLDVAGDIILDAAGDQISMKDAGTERIVFNLDSTPELDVTGDFTIDGTGDITIDAADDVVLTSGGGEHIRLDETATGGSNTKFSIKTYYPDDVKAVFGTGASSDGDWNIYADGGSYSDLIIESEPSMTSIGNMILRNNYQGDIEFADSSSTIFRMDNSSNALVVNSGDIILEGTGRIQGVDTVSSSTDAANKAYVDAHVPTNTQTIVSSHFYDGSSTTSSIRIPFNNLTESTSNQYYNHFDCPANGTIKRLRMHNTSGTMSTSFTTIFDIFVNGGGTPAQSSGSLTASSAAIEYDADYSFSKGDSIQIAYRKSAGSKYWYGVSASMIIEFTQV